MGKGPVKNPREQQIQVEKVFSLDYIVGSFLFLRSAELWEQGESKSMTFMLHGMYITES